MRRWIVMMFAAVGFMGAGQAYAQEVVPGPGVVVVTVIPGGATFFTEGKNTKGPSFGQLRSRRRRRGGLQSLRRC